jgi:hypothetical protein
LLKAIKSEKHNVSLANQNLVEYDSETEFNRFFSQKKELNLKDEPIALPAQIKRF